MAIEVDHGNYQEFTRTPQEERMVQDRKRIVKLECQVLELQEEIEKIKECISELIN